MLSAKKGEFHLAVRMYTLAKELRLDSKDLVDICTKAGVPGKGSALASLSDEEVEKVKSYIAGGGGKKASKGPPAPIKPERPAAAKPTKNTKPQPEPQPEAEPETPTTVRREDYIAPGGVSGKPPVLDTPVANLSTPKSSTPAARSEAPAKPRAKPTVHLAPVPAVEQPKTETAKSNEPAPQKPDLKLPVDAIKASKMGTRPLAGHLRRHEQQLEAQKTEAPKAKSGRSKSGKPPAAPGDVPPLESPLRGKGRKGKDDRGGRDEESKEAKPGKPLLGGREQRQLSRKRIGGDRDDSRRPRRPQRIRRRSNTVSTAAPRKGNVTLSLPCTVRSFSEATGVAARDVLGVLLREGTMANITAQIDPDMAEFIAAELGLEVEFRAQVTLEDSLLDAIRNQEDAPDDLKPRPPVITFLGHVDHGKTSLLDKIMAVDVVSGESGGITQHIRAYQIKQGEERISFVDTPGHEAFTEMRARGANVTDIAVLVVAADDGVMPQTEEAISHARAAEVPIVVALNKVDLPGVDINRVYQGLSTNDLLPSEWGGDVEVVKTSAMTGDGIEELLDTLLTVAELHEWKANPKRAAFGTCLEAQQEGGRGVVAKLIVQNGTLNIGDVVVCGQAHGRVKAMYDTMKPSHKVKHAGPSMPINMTGFDTAPAAGEGFYVLSDIAEAREIAEQRSNSHRADSLVDSLPHVTLENLFDRLGGEGEVAKLNMILRADTRGSIEAVQKELSKLQHEEVQLKILQATVGGITEADVQLADASDAIIIGFNVVPEEGARSLAQKRGIQIRRYDIIYKVTEDIRAALEGMLKPEERDVELGRALVQRTFAVQPFWNDRRLSRFGGNYRTQLSRPRDPKQYGDWRLWPRFATT